MARNDDDEQQEQDAAEQEYEEEEEAGTSINITEETITIAVPRDGNEGDTLSRLAELVDGLGS